MVDNLYIGNCIIGGRCMYNASNSVDKYHFKTKSRGGKEKISIHRICHQKIHSTWTNNFLTQKS